jgi:uncharacterized integral membrane protein
MVEQMQSCPCVELSTMQHNGIIIIIIIIIIIVIIIIIITFFVVYLKLYTWDKTMHLMLQLFYRQNVWHVYCY